MTAKLKIKMELPPRSIAEEIDQLKQRNRRVDTDKAWETSWTRMVVIAAMTYVVAVMLLFILHAPIPFLSAVIPAVGFAFSTFTLPYCKRLWLTRFRK